MAKQRNISAVFDKPAPAVSYMQLATCAWVKREPARAVLGRASALFPRRAKEAFGMRLLLTLLRGSDAGMRSGLFCSGVICVAISLAGCVNSQQTYTARKA